MMNERKNRIFNTLFLAILCTISTMLTAWASPPSGQVSTGIPGSAPGGESGGPGETVVVVVAGDAAKPGATTGSLKQGISLGIVTTTGYCNCSICSGGHGLTYSGTVPKANHTISADIDLFPIGTKLMIHGTVYTVEDIGGAVEGNKIDIYYDNHEDAMAHGSKQEEAFRVE